MERISAGSAAVTSRDAAAKRGARYNQVRRCHNFVDMCYLRARTVMYLRTKLRVSMPAWLCCAEQLLMERYHAEVA